MKEMWVSFYLQDGTQGGATVQAVDIDGAEDLLRKEYGDMWGGIADYDSYDDDVMSGERKEFRCYDCGEYFDEPRYVEEDRGEYWGVPCTERVAYCPCCKWGSIDLAEEVDKVWDAEHQKVLDIKK